MSFIVVKGKVKEGKGFSRKLGFPTINIPASRKIKKEDWGIYFSLVKIDGKFYPGATYFGPPNSLNILKPNCETHLLTLNQDLYGKQVEKRLIFKLRNVDNYPNIRKLKKQIKKDIKKAKKYFGL